MLSQFYFFLLPSRLQHPKAYGLAKLGSHLKYDDDIKVQEENAEGELVDAGPRIQWKQQLGIGVIVEL